MKRTFMRTKLKSKGTFSMFRHEGFTSIWLTLCCTNGSHVERRTEYPRFSLAYRQSAANQQKRGYPTSTLPWIFQTSEPAIVYPLGRMGRRRKSATISSKTTPMFVSMERCPVVPGTRRKVFTMGTYKPSNLTATLLDYGYYASMCAYYGEETAQPKRADEITMGESRQRTNFVSCPRAGDFPTFFTVVLAVSKF